MTFFEVPVSDLGAIFDGPHATPIRREQGKYFLSISSLEYGRLDLGASDFVDREDFFRWTRRVQPREDDLLFAYETRLGQAALMPPGIDAALGRRMALLRPNQEVIDPRFLLYGWISPWFQTQIQQKAIYGATVNRIPLNTLGSWGFKMTDLRTQKAIGEALGALDDKIAVNRRVASAATELQRSLWSYGVVEVPRVPLLEHAPAHLGGTPPRSDESAWGGPVAWASVKDMSAAPEGVILTTLETISKAAASSARRLNALPPGSTFLSARGTVGCVTTNAIPCAINQSAYAFVPPNGHGVALRLAVESLVSSLRANAHGSVFSTITMKTLSDARIPDPSAPGMEHLSHDLDRLESRRVAALTESARLARTRDELLPPLMNGAITVKDAERRVEEVA